MTKTEATAIVEDLKQSVVLIKENTCIAWRTHAAANVKAIFGEYNEYEFISKIEFWSFYKGFSEYFPQTRESLLAFFDNCLKQ